MKPTCSNCGSSIPADRILARPFPGAAIGLASFATASLGVMVLERTDGMAGLVGLMDVFGGINLNASEASLRGLLSSSLAPGNPGLAQAVSWTAVVTALSIAALIALPIKP